jgi:hypothetical protein
MRSMLSVIALLAVVSSCARSDWIDRTLVTVDVTGTWSGGVAQSGSMGNRGVTFELKQEGLKVTGSLRGPLWTSGPIEGTVTGDQCALRRVNGSMSAEMTVSGDEMTGRASGVYMEGTISLRRVDSTSAPISPKP